MSTPVLIIGNKNYSSWSLRPWLLLKANNIAFDEVLVPLYQQDSKVAIQAHAPAAQTPYAKVPILRDGEIRVWDSLAICEYVAERWPHVRAWPESRANRALARAISAEMHAGFATLRSEMPLNCRRAPAPVPITAALQADIDRVIEIWTGCRASSASGPFLFGCFGIADAMFAPVVLRFSIYAVALSGAARTYAAAVQALPALQRWLADARSEPYVLEKFER